MLDKESFDYIFTITIPNYIREVTLAEQQNAQYYEWKDGYIKGKKPVPRECIIEKFKKERRALPDHLKEPFKLAVIDKQSNVVGLVDTVDDIKNEVKTHPVYKGLRLRLYNTATGVYVLANPNKVGQPSKSIINGQRISSGVVREFTKGKIFEAIKKNFKEHYDTLPNVIVPNNQYPVIIVYELVDTVINTIGGHKKSDKLGARWDVGNRLGPYQKCILDAIVDEKIIVDDERMYVTGEFGIFTPLPDNSDMYRCLKIHLYQDRREIILNNKYYKQMKPAIKSIIQTISQEEIFVPEN